MEGFSDSGEGLKKRIIFYNRRVCDYFFNHKMQLEKPAHRKIEKRERPEKDSIDNSQSTLPGFVHYIIYIRKNIKTRVLAIEITGKKGRNCKVVHTNIASEL